MDEKLQELIRKVVKKALWEEIELSEMIELVTEEYQTQLSQNQNKDLFMERKEEFYRKANYFCQKEKLEEFDSVFATSQQRQKSIELLWQCYQSMLSGQKRTTERREEERNQAAKNLHLSPYTMASHEGRMLLAISIYFSPEEKEQIRSDKRMNRKEMKIMFEEVFVQKILGENK